MTPLLLFEGDDTAAEKIDDGDVSEGVCSALMLFLFLSKKIKQSYSFAFLTLHLPHLGAQKPK